MTRCLNDRQLLLLYGGESAGIQRDHLSACNACASRYERLAHDLESISRTLRQGPPPGPTSAPIQFSVRWVSACMALAVVLLLIWTGIQSSHFAKRPGEIAFEELWNSSLVPSSNLFLLSEAMAVEPNTMGSSAELASRILESDRPCEWYDLPLTDAMESRIEEADGSRPASCIEIGPDPKNTLPRRKAAKNVS